MKILDRYILSSYLKTFISVFVILMLIFVLQAIWLYIKELAGKDLDIVTVIKFLCYITPTLIPLILPLTILLASIMVFGNFAENYEFAAMKSTGISLQRAMSGLSIFIVLLSITTFFFSNNVIPWAQYESYNLRKNIAKVKPAMAIAEGQFNQIGEDFNIKVVKKSGDRGQFLEDITIHQIQKGKSGNHKTTVAKTGELVSREDSDVLQLILYNGYYYDDTPPKDYKKRTKRPFTKSFFKKYIMNLDLSSLNPVDMQEKHTDSKYSMLTVNELDYTIDSLSTERKKFHATVSSSLYTRTNIATVNLTVDTKKDTLFTGKLLDLFQTKRKVQLLDYAVNSTSSTIQILKTKNRVLKNKTIRFNRHIMAFHEKFALGFACIILFFVGAPLGALIKKGGLGLPMVIAIVLFLTYHFLGIFAKNSAKDGSINPSLAPWISTLIMLPLSIYLTTRATKDRGLFETDGLLEPLKKMFGIKRKAISVSDAHLEANSDAYTTLEGYDNNKLINVIQNYRQYDYTIAYKNSAVSILNTRGITTQQLKFEGHFTNQKYEEAVRLKEGYEEDSKLTIILYFIALIFILTGLILNNNKLASIGTPLSIFGYLVGAFFLIALSKADSKLSNLKKQLGENIIVYNILFFVVGMPLYFVNFYFQRKKLEEVLKWKTKEAVISKENTIENTPLFNTNIKKSTAKIPTKYKDYKTVTTITYLFYSIAFVLFILHFVFNNNKLPQLAESGIQLSAISLIVYIVHYIKSYLSFRAIYTETNDIKTPKNLLLLLIGFIFYPIVHLFRHRKIKSDFTF